MYFSLLIFLVSDYEQQTKLFNELDAILSEHDNSRPELNPGHMVPDGANKDLETQEILGDIESFGPDAGDSYSSESGYESGSGEKSNEGAEADPGQDQQAPPYPEGTPSESTKNIAEKSKRHMDGKNSPIKKQPGATAVHPEWDSVSDDTRSEWTGYDLTDPDNKADLCELVIRQSRLSDGRYGAKYKNALDATSKYLVQETQGKPVDKAGARQPAGQTRERMARAISDGGQSCINCMQCIRNPSGDKLPAHRHNFAQVRSAIVMKEPNQDHTKFPRILNTFQMATCPLSDLSDNDEKEYGRPCYWNDTSFYTDMIYKATWNLHKAFPFRQFKQTSIQYELEPAAISYETAKDSHYVDSIGHFTGTAPTFRNLKKPVPKHVLPDPDFQGLHKHNEFDASFTITFLCSVDTSPATKLQITAKDDELATRLKMITNSGPHTSLTTLGKIFLTYADYQAKQNHPNPPTPYPKVQPIEATLDKNLRKRLKKIEKMEKKKLNKKESNQGSTKQTIPVTTTQPAEALNNAPYHKAHGLKNPFRPNNSDARHSKGRWDTTLQDRNRRIRFRTATQWTYPMDGKTNPVSQWTYPVGENTNHGHPQAPPSYAAVAARQTRLAGSNTAYLPPAMRGRTSSRTSSPRFAQRRRYDDITGGFYTDPMPRSPPPPYSRHQSTNLFDRPPPPYSRPVPRRNFQHVNGNGPSRRHQSSSPNRPKRSKLDERK